MRASLAVLVLASAGALATPSLAATGTQGLKAQVRQIHDEGRSSAGRLRQQAHDGPTLLRDARTWATQQRAAAEGQVRTLGSRAHAAKSAHDAFATDHSAALDRFRTADAAATTAKETRDRLGKRPRVAWGKRAKARRDEIDQAEAAVESTSAARTTAEATKSAADARLAQLAGDYAELRAGLAVAERTLGEGGIEDLAAKRAEEQRTSLLREADQAEQAAKARIKAHVLQWAKSDHPRYKALSAARQATEAVKRDLRTALGEVDQADAAARSAESGLSSASSMNMMDAFTQNTAIDLMSSMSSSSASSQVGTMNSRVRALNSTMATLRRRLTELDRTLKAVSSGGARLEHGGAGVREAAFDTTAETFDTVMDLSSLGDGFGAGLAGDLMAGSAISSAQSSVRATRSGLERQGQQLRDLERKLDGVLGQLDGGADALVKQLLAEVAPE